VWIRFALSIIYKINYFLVTRLWLVHPSRFYTMVDTLINNNINIWVQSLPKVIE
jgi:hypothetical protein